MPDSSSHDQRRKGDYLIEQLPTPGLREWTHDRTGRKRWTFTMQVNGVRSERTLQVLNRTQAKAEAERLRGDVANGDPLVKSSRLKLRDLFALYSEHVESQIAAGERSQRAWEESMLPKWRLYIEPEIGSEKVAELAKGHISKVLQAVTAKGRSSWHAKGVLNLLSAICEYGAAHDYMRANPVRSMPKALKPKVRDKRETYAPSQEEVERILKASSDRWRPYLTLLADTGVRASEGLGLRWQDLNFDTSKIIVEAQLERGGSERQVLKTEQSKRDVHMTPRLYKLLKPMRGAPEAYVFASEDVAPVYGNAYRALGRAVKKAKIATDEKRFGLHSLRHAYATRLILGGIDAQVVARLLGHSSTALLFARYSHAFETLRAGNEIGAMVDRALRVVSKVA